MVNDLALSLQIVRAMDVQSMKRNQLCFRRSAMIASSAARALKDLRRSPLEQLLLTRLKGKKLGDQPRMHPEARPGGVSAIALVSCLRPTHNVHAHLL
jgi:hypothetical protein